MTSLSPGHTDSGADYRFYNLFIARFISESQTTLVLHGMDWRVPSGQPIGWDFTEVDGDFVGSNVDLTRLHATLSDWGDARDEDEVEGDCEEEPEENIEVLPRVLTDEEKLVAIGEYLCRVGEIPEVVLEGGYDALVAYVQGSLHLSLPWVQRVAS